MMAGTVAQRVDPPDPRAPLLPSPLKSPAGDTPRRPVTSQPRRGGPWGADRSGFPAGHIVARMRYWKRAPVIAVTVLATALVLLAGCDTASTAQQDAPPPEQAPPSAPPSPAEPVASPAPVVIPGLRPLTAAQRQQRDSCQQGVVRNGCQFYTDDSLRLQGIDPDS